MKITISKYILFLIFPVVAPLISFADNLSSIEDSISISFKELSNAKNDNERYVHSEKMRQLFIRSFSDPAVFNYPFEKLNFCKIISSDDHIRLLNWNLPLEDGTFRYYCFVLVKNETDQAVTWTELIDNIREGDKLDSRFLTSDKWLGALYYDVIPVFEKRKKKKTTTDTYVLLGWDGKDNLTTRKIIDGLTITGSKIRLGVASFEIEKSVKKRIILEYSNDVSASIKYYPKKKSIVMDHLSPKSPGLEGIYAEYGPDGTYDLFLFEKGKWIYFDKIDISQFSESDDKPYKDPRQKK